MARTKGYLKSAYNVLHSFQLPYLYGVIHLFFNTVYGENGVTAILLPNCTGGPILMKFCMLIDTDLCSEPAKIRLP